MDAFAQQFAERRMDSALSLDPAQPGESGAFDDEREMAFAPRIVPRVADVLVALVF